MAQVILGLTLMAHTHLLDNQPGNWSFMAKIHIYLRQGLRRRVNYGRELIVIQNLCHYLHLSPH